MDDYSNFEPIERSEASEYHRKVYFHKYYAS